MINMELKDILANAISIVAGLWLGFGILNKITKAIRNAFTCEVSTKISTFPKHQPEPQSKTTITPEPELVHAPEPEPVAATAIKKFSSHPLPIPRSPMKPFVRFAKPLICPICERPMPKNNLGYHSHMRYHVRRGEAFDLHGLHIYTNRDDERIA
jgi:hypothetical protein